MNWKLQNLCWIGFKISSIKMSTPVQFLPQETCPNNWHRKQSKVSPVFRWSFFRLSFLWMSRPALESNFHAGPTTWWSGQEIRCRLSLHSEDSPWHLKWELKSIIYVDKSYRKYWGLQSINVTCQLLRVCLESCFLNEGLGIKDGHRVIGKPCDNIRTLLQVKLNDVRFVQSDRTLRWEMVFVGKDFKQSILKSTIKHAQCKIIVELYSRSSLPDYSGKLKKSYLGWRKMLKVLNIGVK